MPGNFFGSTIVELRPGDSQPQTLSLVAGLALIEALDKAAPRQALMLKWPNDVLLAGRKLSGILLERSGDRVVIGFGVNLADAPRLDDREAASLPAPISVDAFAPLLAERFAVLVGLWRENAPAQLTKAWLARAHPVGTPLSVHASSGDLVSGTFDGIEPDGSLRLRLPNGETEIVRAADVDLS